jgi:hypothetical protein
MKTLLLLLASCAIAAAAGPANPCNQSAVINISSSGTTTIANAQGGAAVRVCKIVFSASSAVNITLYGGLSAITGVFQNVSSFAFDFEGQLTTGAGNSLALNLSAPGVTLGGVVTYYQAAQ